MLAPALLPTTPYDARNSTFYNVGGNQHLIYPPPPVSESNETLISLKPVDRSGYYVPPCMEGTRENVLKDIDQWLDDVNAPNVLWLHGCPGVGKSALASTLISRLTERRRLGSSFFFKRGDIMLSDPAAVWRTIAYDLAQHSTTFADNLVEILKGRTILHKRPDVALHFKFLIEIPLTKSYDQSDSSRDVPVIVIDALDECNSEGPRGAQKRHFLHTLTQWSHLSHRFKLIILVVTSELYLNHSATSVCRWHSPLVALSAMTLTKISAVSLRNVSSIYETLCLLGGSGNEFSMS